MFLNYRQGIEENRPFYDCETSGLKFESGRSSYDITINIVDNKGGLSLILFNVQEEHDGETMLKNFVNLLDAFLRNQSQDITQVALYKQDKYQSMLGLQRGKPWRYIRFQITITDLVKVL